MKELYNVYDLNRFSDYRIAKVMATSERQALLAYKAQSKLKAYVTKFGYTYQLYSQKYQIDFVALRAASTDEPL